jgi:predicted glutamine amidotransferase
MRHLNRHSGTFYLSLLFSIVSLFCLPLRAGDLSDTSHECRLWGFVSGDACSGAIQDHLADFPNSIKNLSHINDDGWGVGYYFLCRTTPVIYRGQPPAYLDPAYDSAVADVAMGGPRVAMVHIRRCSSGLCRIPDPHPFERIKHGRHWLMEHNGTIGKEVLLALIRPDYLAANPPQNGGNDTIMWVDSELYFIFILQTLEDFGWQVKPALGHVIRSLQEILPEAGRTLNFLLTDGTDLWAYREGNTLFYLYDSSNRTYSVVASQYPSAAIGNWIEMLDGQIVTLYCDFPPLVENIEDYFDNLMSATK